MHQVREKELRPSDIYMVSFTFMSGKLTSAYLINHHPVLRRRDKEIRSEGTWTWDCESRQESGSETECDGSSRHVTDINCPKAVLRSKWDANRHGTTQWPAPSPSDTSAGLTLFCRWSIITTFCNLWSKCIPRRMTPLIESSGIPRSNAFLSAGITEPSSCDVDMVDGSLIPLTHIFLTVQCTTVQKLNAKQTFNAFVKIGYVCIHYSLRKSSVSP